MIQQEPVRRHVALKVIKLGMDTKQVIARFEAERQALALMDYCRPYAPSILSCIFLTPSVVSLTPWFQRLQPGGKCGATTQNCFNNLVSPRGRR